MKKIITGTLTFDGAGVRLSRIFSHATVKETDPFLLLDHFGSDDPQEYMKGFPWHPHRGIETITYMLKGSVEHCDNIGNKGVIRSGDIQWMSAGSGIVHQEMPKGEGGMEGIQLWVNMPAKKKMSDPRYRGILQDQVPLIKREGISIRVISGAFEGNKGPADDLVIDINYFDIILEDGHRLEYDLPPGHTSLCYVIEGKGLLLGENLHRNQLLLLKDIDKFSASSKDRLRFLLVTGKPLKEPIAWGGPIVMNTKKELDQAFGELSEGTFIKVKNEK